MLINYTLCFIKMYLHTYRYIPKYVYHFGPRFSDVIAEELTKIYIMQAMIN